MFDPEIVQAIKAHAVREYPKESCGVVSEDHYVELENVHEQPEDHFRIDTRIYTGFLAKSGMPGVQAVIHSHPNGPDHPTKDDMQCQIDTAVPWGIVTVNQSGPLEPFFFGDQVPTPPLLKRVFRVGVTDCYALVRDWFAENTEIRLPAFPRGMFWENEKEDVLGENFYSMGFREIPALERVGDCFLVKIRSSIENHCGVYLGRGLILHHLTNRLSCREPFGRWIKHKPRFLRHKDMQ